MHRLKFAWSDYFSGNADTELLQREYTSSLSYSSGSIYVLNCLFNSFTSTSTGGALYCSSITNLLIESTSFFSCKTSSSSGGAVFFSSSCSHCVLYKVCGSDCCARTSGSSSYQFGYIGVNNGASNKNYVNYSSISRCENGRSDSHHTLYVDYGKICCPSVNLSMNKCGYYPGIYCYPFKDSSSFTCLLSYSSFTDNTTPGYICNYHSNSGSKHEMKCCNIIRNTQVSSSNGIIYANAIIKIEDSCILENAGNCIFYSTSSTNTITISNCTVDKTSNNGYLTIQNTVIKSFILGLNHISTQNCHSEYDSAGTLTPIVRTPTSSKKPVICHTYGKHFYQPQLSDFFSLISSFIINFINPYAFS
jgi:hypothetical protein